MKVYMKIFICLLGCGLLTSTVFLGNVIELSAGAKEQKNNAGDCLDGTNCVIKIIASDPTTTTWHLEGEGYDILYDTITSDSVQLIVTPEELHALENEGYDPTILSVGRPFVDIQYEQVLDRGLLPPGYPSVQEIIDNMTYYATAYPEICALVDLTTFYGLPETYNGRHLYAVKISDNVVADEDEPAFLMVSCHHAREVVTPVLALYAIEQFTTQYGTSPQITSLVNGHEIWISPLWNPDGYDYVYNYDNWWRKNRQYFPQYGTYGVDLNRNYPFGWSSGCSGSSTPSSSTYKGPSPASEIETQTMIALGNDKHFAKVIDYHSYGREVLYAYCCHSHPFQSFYASEATQISSMAGYGGSIRIPSAEGEQYEWQMNAHGAYAFLMETSYDFQPSYASALSEAVQVFPSTLWMLERPLSLSGHVKDAVTGEPVVATLTFQGITFPNGELFTSEEDFGRFHVVLPPASYTVVFSAPEYIPQSFPVTVTQTSAQVLEVELLREQYLPDPEQSSVMLTNTNMPGLLTCPLGDGLPYQYLIVTVRNAGGYPLPGIPADAFEFTVTPVLGTSWFDTLSCTFTPVEEQTNVAGELSFIIQGDTSIVGDILIHTTVQEIPLMEVAMLSCRSVDVDVDGIVGLSDFTIVGQAWGGYDWRCDFTFDDDIDLEDLTIFGAHFGHHPT